jgi:hypothetical protein
MVATLTQKPLAKWWHLSERSAGSMASANP